MKAVIIEDEQRASRQLHKMVQELNLPIDVVASLSSVTQSLEWFETNPLPDFIISDIQLGDGSAFDIFQEIEEVPPVIFTTAYDEYALKAFQNNGIDYLLKPIDPEELKAAIEKLKKISRGSQAIDLSSLEQLLNVQKPAIKTRFMIKLGDKLKSIPIEKISLFYSLNGATYLRTIEDRNYCIDYSMDQLEEDMDRSRFFRVNRALIVSYDSLDTIHLWSGSRLKIQLKKSLNELDSDILVSRDRVKEFKSWLDR